jgi:hypothetical protein
MASLIYHCHQAMEPIIKLLNICRMPSSRMLRRVALVRTDVSKEPSASFIRVTRIGISSQRTSVASSR